MPKQVYSLRLESELKSQLDTLAKHQSRSFSNMVEYILKEYIDQQNAS